MRVLLLIYNHSSGGRLRLRRGLGAVLMSFLGLLSFSAPAQPSNDNIENRRRLQTEEVVASTTAGSTVQRSCVDERLTGRCIQYHNDQWFEFTPGSSGRYYINIGGQRCRDVRGVQLVVLSGEPCQPASYRILNCASLGNQDDVFMTLDSLRAGRPYLLNVDGYLHDYCQFSLQVSRQPAGQPVSYSPPSPQRVLRTANRVVELSWTLPDSLAATPGFRVLRREIGQYHSTELRQLPVRRDTYGRPQAAYTYTDTLRAPGTYAYHVLTTRPETGPAPVRLREWWYSFGVAAAPAPGSPPARADVQTLPLARYPRNARLSVVITDPATGRVLLARQLQRDARNPRQGEVWVRKWRAAGLETVAVSITCHPLRGDFFTDKLLWSLLAPADRP